MKAWRLGFWMTVQTSPWRCLTLRLAGDDRDFQVVVCHGKTLRTGCKNLNLNINPCKKESDKQVWTCYMKLHETGNFGTCLWLFVCWIPQALRFDLPLEVRRLLCRGAPQSCGGPSCGLARDHILHADARGQKWSEWFHGNPKEYESIFLTN